jgi:hypothetical protein
MHAWSPSLHPRTTPPPKSFTKLEQSFYEYDREHSRIQLIERSIMAQEHYRQQKNQEQYKKTRLATQAYRALNNAYTMPENSSIRGQHNQQQQQLGINHNNTIISPSKRKIRINDHLSSDETKSIKRSIKHVNHMRKHAKKIEAAERATQHLLAVNKRKKEVERLLDQLTAQSNSEELKTNQKETKATRKNVNMDLNSVQMHREQCQLQLSTIIDTKDLLKNFELTPPELLSGVNGKILDTEKAFSQVSKWAEKAMETNKSLLLFAANTKNILEDQIEEISSNVDILNNNIAKLKNDKLNLANAISKLKRELSETINKIKSLDKMIINYKNKIKFMENEFNIRTKALNDELVLLKNEIKNLSSQLHIIQMERDELLLQTATMKKNIRKLEVNLADTLQELSVVKRKNDGLIIERDKLLLKLKDKDETIMKHENSINDLNTEIIHINNQMNNMEAKFLKEKEMMIEKHTSEMKEVQNNFKKYKKESETTINTLQKEIQLSKDQMARDAERLKKQKEQASKLAEEKERAKVLAKKQEDALKKALYRPPVSTTGTQAPEGNERQLEEERLKKIKEKERLNSIRLTRLKKERFNMLMNDKESLQLIIKNINTDHQIELKKQKEYYIKMNEKKPSKDLGIQTPIELLNDARNHMNKNQLSECLKNERLAKIVVQKWLSESVSKIFLNDNDLKHVMNKIDFNRKGPATHLLKLIRLQTDRRLLLSNIILKDVNRHHQYNNINSSFIKLKCHRLIENSNWYLKEEEKKNKGAIKIISKYKSKLIHQNVVHEQELLELELRVLREESTSSTTQAKTYKSIAELIRQTTNMIENVQQRRLGGRKEYKNQPETQQRMNEVQKLNTDHHSPVLFQSPVTPVTPPTPPTHTVATPPIMSKEDMKEYDQMKALGQQCARWMLLIEKRLPMLLASSDRKRKEIGRLNKKNQMKRSTHSASNVGYEDQMRQIKVMADTMDA